MDTRKRFFGLLSISIVCLVSLSAFAAFYLSGPKSQTSLQDSSPNSPNGGLNVAGPITIKLDGGNSSAAAVSAGSTAQGTILIDILQVSSLRFYIDDYGWNTTKSVLPAGISVSLNVYRNNYDLLQATGISDYNALPIVPATVGKAAIQYTIKVGSEVPPGTYNINILLQTFQNDGTLLLDGVEYKVILHVQ